MRNPDHEGPDSEHGGEDRVDDFLAGFSAAYRTLDTPESSEHLEHCDAGTQAAVCWMQGAWSELEIPAPRLPSGRQGLLWPMAPAKRAMVLLAAALLLALAFWSQRPLPALEPLLGEEMANQEPQPSSPDTPALAPPEGGAQPPKPEVSVSPGLAANNTEFHSGRVTLVLVAGA